MKTQLKTQLKTAVCALYKYSGLMPMQEILLQLRDRSFLTVLLFHRVTDAIPEDGLTVGLQAFRAMCRMLAHRFHVVSLSEIARLARSGKPLPRRTVAITFDDCYHDNLQAARILAAYKLPATFFIPTAFVGTDHVFPWDRKLKRMPNLTWDDLCSMVQLGFEIGSHTVNHPDLGTVTPEEARHEIIDSKLILEKQLGTRVRWFAYPFGGVKNFHVEWLPFLSEAGYEGCVSAYGGFIHRGMNTSILPRQSATGFSSALSLEVFLSGSVSWYYDFKKRLGLYQPWQTFVPVSVPPVEACLNELVHSSSR